MTIALQLYDDRGNPIRLGNQLGSGGEGAVYEIQNLPNQVAKLYHKPISAEQIAKLNAMVKATTPQLVSVAAWPTNTLRDRPNGVVKGLVMPKVENYREIHHLYGPAHRKRDFPKADWAFLIHAARNVANVFEIIHNHGHVIGDVNQGNILVANDTTCRLIDCDSFQIASNQKIFFCEVGVPQFTPPELQSRAFRGITRSQNHDNFGLALICFHLLFMGRHPFAGKYSGTEDMPIERAISEYRYAYSTAAVSKRMAPPPNVLTMDAVPYRLRQLFERAFNEAANRPVPGEWVQELNALRNRLRTCSRNSAHKYLSDLQTCPWCNLEKNSGVLYFLAQAPTVVGDIFDFKQVWALIQSIQPASTGAFPVQIPYTTVSPTPLPPSQLASRLRRLGRFGRWLYSLVKPLDGTMSNELARRHRALEQIQGQWQNAQRVWHQHNWNEPFHKKQQHLEGIKQDWERLKVSYDREKEKASLIAYLDQFLIEKANIPGIGEKLTLVLQYWGIETAADVERSKVLAVHGFGPKRTGDLVAWRSSLEAKYRRLPQSSRKIATPQLDQRFAQQRQQLEKSLRGGAEELQAINKQIAQEKATFLEQCRQIAQRLAQAQADVSIKW
ncbi:hypothetical protein IQ250_24790 [Pseudanabaenaceae cyanobacterium LEGE 13415]|nr:hypothetical protein [Pseudanabaenaceae cyanobacterium LEGE 13415]